MDVASGVYPIGPHAGSLRLRTYRQGAAARAGHDLVIEVADWSGTATVDRDQPSASSISLRVDAASLRVLSGSGGIKPLTEKDKADIERAAGQKVLDTSRHPEITFASQRVGYEAGTVEIDGELTIKGVTRPVHLSATLRGTEITGSVPVTQSDWGIKPYSALMGALKLRDTVDVDFAVLLEPR